MTKLFISFLMLLTFLQVMQAQVTIGSDDSPLDGALLQLKQNDGLLTNATKGLGLPRVNLTDLVNLYPMFATGSGVYSGASKELEDENHIGLLVYNVNQCLLTRFDGDARGMFVWDGEQWQMLNVKITLPTETAANSNRSDWATVWDKKVILHQAKENVYDEFTSADFGAAGRWMTTNLSAKAYDGVTHSQNRALLGPPNYNNTSNAYNVAYWSYPNVDGLGKPMESTEYDKDKALGYLYTWDAATAGKGGLNGTQNINNTSGGGLANNEAGYASGSTTGKEQRIQGICPLGWHLPSDYEWTELENVMFHRTSLYSDLADINPLEPNYFAPDAPGSIELRGWHGRAMKRVCNTDTNYDPNGASNVVGNGGFSVTMPGINKNGTGQNFGMYTYIWSSSSGSGSSAWNRRIQTNTPAVGRYMTGREYLFSVRCKKD